MVAFLLAVALAEACFRLGPSTRGRVDVGTLDTTTWFCGQ
jgi:hypothetical protein